METVLYISVGLCLAWWYTKWRDSDTRHLRPRRKAVRRQRASWINSTDDLTTPEDIQWAHRDDEQDRRQARRALGRLAR